jgi:hypothetical protein
MSDGVYDYRDTTEQERLETQEWLDYLDYVWQIGGVIRNNFIRG